MRSRVVPAGTATLFKIMVAQAALDLTAEAALVKVQVVARSASSARAVGAGAAAGAELARDTEVAKRLRMVLIWTILAVKARKNGIIKNCEKRMLGKACECSTNHQRRRKISWMMILMAIHVGLSIPFSSRVRTADDPKEPHISSVSTTNVKESES